jgi:hypothetical protein
MEKEIAFRTILDICDACGGVFLAPEELEYLEELATNRGYERGYDDGRSTGSSSSVAMGFVIGSAIG